MSHLEISLLGPFYVTLDDKPVTRFSADTARALLAYLAMRPGVAHRRSTLAGLLWPEQPDAEALRNLRVALSRLRDAIGDQEAKEPFLLVSRTTIQLDPQGAISLDVQTFRALLAATKAHDHERLEACAACAGWLGEAAALYRGEFLAEFSLDSAPFEEWMVVEREGLHWQALEALSALAGYHEGRGQYQEVIGCARRQVELEPWQESAHRQWMQALALSGHRGTALAQYETCRRVLEEELGVEPEEETRALYERIRDGTLQRPVAEVVLTSPAPPGAEPGPVQRAVEAEPASPLGPAPGPFEGERRIVTVLFAVVECVAIGERALDIEGRAEAVSGALWLIESEVVRLGGEVSQRRGNGLVATFGAAIAHEDDPERAVLSSVTIEEAMGRYGADMGQGEGIELRVRMGISTGEAIVTRMGDGRSQRVDTALGERASLGDRLVELGGPGGARVAEQTYDLVQALFEWQALGETAIQGVRHPVAVYRPLGHKPKVSKARGIEGLSSPLVGRDAEFGALQGAVARLRDGIGGIVTVVGEAGIGKSRLVTEVRQIAGDGPRSAAGGLTWIEGRCLSYATSVAYQVWVDVLRGLLGVAPDAAPPAAASALREQVRALCPDCAHNVYPFLVQMMSLPLTGEAEARLRGIEGEGLKVLTFRAVETLLDRAARQAPLVVVCEDLHWADPTSLALLEHLLPLTDRVPLLLICVFRPESEHGSWRVRETAARLYGHRHTDLSLDPLTERESVELVGHLLRMQDLPEELQGHVLGHAEGNPFYVEEILRALIDGGIIVHDEAVDPSTGLRASTPEHGGGCRTSRWRATEGVADIPLPDTLRGVLVARIDRLPEATRHVLQLASVVGRIFEGRVLEGISQRGRELDDDLVTLQRAQMIRQRARLPAAAYTFKHQLTQEAAYESLLRRKRRDLHRRVAQALERLYPERVEEQLGLLAHHWERAGDVERAIAYLWRAGEQAAAHYANAEAVAYFGRALDMTPGEEQEGRYALLLAREQVCDLQGWREAQKQDLASLGKLVEALDDDGKRAEVTLRQARCAIRIGEYAKAIPLIQLAIRLGQAAQDATIEAAGYREWGRALSGQGEYEAAQPHLERALALAQEGREMASSAGTMRQVEAESLHTLGVCFLNLGKDAKARSCFEQELLIARETGNRRREGEALRDVGFACLWQGDFDTAQGCLAQSLRVCRETANRRDEGWALISFGYMFLQMGDYAKSKGYLEQALSICRQVGDQPSEHVVLHTLATISCDQGSYVEAEACWDQALHLDHDKDGSLSNGEDLLGLALVSARLGDYARARDYAERALPAIREAGFDLSALSFLGWVSHDLGDDKAAREYCRRAQQGLQNPRMPTVTLAIVLTDLGHALTGLGDLVEAADAYREALALHRRTGQHHLAVELLAGLAHISLIQGDLTSAMALVEQAWSYLKGHPAPCGRAEPFLGYLVCYSVLRANGDPRAREVLSAGHALLREQADMIDDPELRRSYLENVPAHREIVAEYEQHKGMES